MSSKKVITIGLDGVDWRLLSPWIKAGYLPTLAKLVSEGASGKLRSTIRPESSVAWSSFSTGVNPGKHGVFGFVSRIPNSYSFRLANANSVRVKRFWQLLGEIGFKTGICHVPFTYPPAPLNGTLVTGMLTPNSDVVFTFPPELKDRLLNHFNTYIFDVGETVNDKTLLIDSVYELTKQQLETALLLLEDDWDFFSVIFTGSDRLQHFLWSDMNSQESDFQNTLRSYYQFLDKAVSKILEQVPSDTLVFVISDHGFNGVAKRFFVNHWLSQHGYLTFKPPRSSWSGLIKLATYAKSVPLIRRLKRVFLPIDWGSANFKIVAFKNAIDWTHTKAYFGLDGGIRINLSGREPKGIVDPGDEYDALRLALQHELLNIEESQTKQRILSRVYFREELYSGKYVDTAPDLIIEPQRGNFDITHNWILDGALRGDKQNIFGLSLPYSGNHDLDGILIIWGKGTRNISIKDAEIIDIAPTILAIFGTGVPVFMDGKVLSNVFLPNRLPSIQYQTSVDVSPSNKISDSVFNLKEAQLVEDRLRDLGYLD